MQYKLYYWPSIQGRGEFVRLALEAVGAIYLDVARLPGKGFGIPALMRLMDARRVARAPFAPPFLQAGPHLIGQTANILLFLGARHGLAPRDEAGRLWTHQLQLTIADFVAEAHDTHHPVAAGLYYEDQKSEARRRAEDFRQSRLPKYLGYFESVLSRNKRGPYLMGARLTYADLSLFQLVVGLDYAFPQAMASAARHYKRVLKLSRAVQERPRIAAYLASDRRIAFNQEGIFRHYAELDSR
ncbi:MAG TPA: glutathione S-transferase family protein [Steroidobacteraceae bacterium]|nr:glutathione S-transferase family protein [Steroidobacteraceae bacterium]